MTETTVSKDNVEKALAVGDEASRINKLLKGEAESLQAELEHFRKTRKLKLDILPIFIREKLRSLSEETEDLVKLLDAFAGIRYSFVRDTLERKVRQSVPNQISVTNTELLIVDNLSNPEIYKLYEKYKGREYFAVDEKFKVEDLFSAPELEEAHRKRVKSDWLLYGFYGFVFLSILIQGLNS